MFKERQIRLTPKFSNNSVNWSIEEYRGWWWGWISIGTTASLEIAKNIIETMKESEQ